MVKCFVDSFTKLFLLDVYVDTTTFKPRVLFCIFGRFRRTPNHDLAAGRLHYLFPTVTAEIFFLHEPRPIVEPCCVILCMGQRDCFMLLRLFFFARLYFADE